MIDRNFLIGEWHGSFLGNSHDVLSLFASDFGFSRVVEINRTIHDEFKWSFSHSDQEITLHPLKEWTENGFLSHGKFKIEATRTADQLNGVIEVLILSFAHEALDFEESGLKLHYPSGVATAKFFRKQNDSGGS